jgi:ABC-2 type transport system permease protein
MADTAATTDTATPADTVRTDAPFPAFNTRGVSAIYSFQMARFFRTLGESVATPVITSGLYFVVFGGAMGRVMPQLIPGVDYGSFIVPGVIMLSILTNSIFNASFGIYFPKFTGTIYEVLSAPISPIETVIGFVGAAATKSVFLGLCILATAYVFQLSQHGFDIAAPDALIRLDHPLAMLGFLALVSFAFSLFGFIIGVWAQSFEQLNFIPMLVVTPLTMLGGSFYPLNNLPGIWHALSLLNPVAYLLSGYRWTFFSNGDVGIWWSLLAVLVFIGVLLGVTIWIFKTGYRLKN